MKIVPKLACLLAVLLGALAWAQAASIEVSAPPDRLALPGAFVTLVYMVNSSLTGQAQVEVTSQHGFTLLAPPPTLNLSAGVTAPVAVTVEIPSDAPALTVDAVTVSVTMAGVEADGAVHITVGEKRGVAIQAPPTVPVSAGQVPFTLVNQGNVEEKGTLLVTQGGKKVLERVVTLAGSAHQTVTVPATTAGSYQATFSVGGKALARALTRVVQESVPAPPPIQLHADVTGSLDTSATWGFSVRVRGPLSDYLTTSGALYADRPRSSSLSLDAARWQASIGALGGGPLGLSLPSELGVRGAYKLGPWTIGGATTWLGSDRFAGYAFGGRQDRHTVYAGAVGLHAGAPMATLSAGEHHKASAWTVTATLLDGSLSGTAAASQQVPETEGTANVSVGVSRLLTDAGTLQFAAGYSDRMASLYGSVTAPIGSGAVGSARGGTVLRLPVPIAGGLFLQLQGGTDQSFASLAYAAALGSGIQTSDSLGITDAGGAPGVHASTSWAYVAGPGNTLGADADLTYTPADGSLTGRVSARYAAGFGPAAFSLSGGWDLSQETVGVGSAVTWNGGPWSLQVNGDAGLDTRTSALSFGLGVSGTIALDVDVPDSVVRAAGGRRLGTLEGYVHAGSAGVPGVTVKVGAYEARTGKDGHFEVQLPPGDVHLALDLASLPIQYQVEGPLDRTVTLVARQTVHADFPVVASAALTGHVLLDSDGNGTPDSPARSGGGTVLLTTGTGNPRPLTVDANGAFSARGLLPGTATLKLANLPLGAQVEGADAQTVGLRAGEVSHATFLVEPAAVSAPVFGANSFRIRSVETEVSQVPPGAAPLVTVKVEGHADRVLVVVNGTDHALTGTDHSWTGRIPVPSNARSGVLRYQVVARSGASTSKRDGQLLVDPTAKAVSAAAEGAGKVGGSQHVSLTVYLQAASVTLASPFGGEVQASEAQPGRWKADLPVPDGTTPGVHSARYTVTTQDGRTLTGTVRFRVLAP